MSTFYEEKWSGIWFENFILKAKISLCDLARTFKVYFYQISVFL